MKNFRILIADSDPIIRRFIRSNLEERGYETLMAMDDNEAIKVIQKESPDLIVMNTGLPEREGSDLLQCLREWPQIPVIIISVSNDDESKIKCLNLGAEDYLTKPFRIEELLARIRNLLRRVEPLATISEHPSFSCGDLEIKFGERRVTVADHEIKLTPTEYNLLLELAQNAEKVLTHNALLNKVWGPKFGQEREYLRVFVGRLRKKLESDPHKPNYIVTIPWVGYKLSNSIGSGLEGPGKVAPRYS